MQSGTAARRGFGRRLFCAPGMGADLAVRVRCGRGSTSPLAKGKGVRREAESGGSRRQSHDPRNTNLIRGCAAWVSWRTTAKPEAAKGRCSRWGGCGAKVSVLTRGGLPGTPATLVTRAERPG